MISVTMYGPTCRVWHPRFLRRRKSGITIETRPIEAEKEDEMKIEGMLPLDGTISEQGWNAFGQLVKTGRILEEGVFDALVEKTVGKVYERWLGAQFYRLCEDWNAAQSDDSATARQEIRARMRLTAWFGLGDIKQMEGPIEELNNLRRMATP